MDIRSIERNNNLHIGKNIQGSKLSLFGSGGICDIVLYPRSIIQLVWVIDQLSGDNYTLIGRGSNTLISDRGYNGIIISTSGLKNIDVDGNNIYCEAGANLNIVSRTAKVHELSGLEKLSAIPGSIGGATFMNAGAYGSDMASVVDYADILINDRIERIFAKDLGFSYRRSSMMDNGGIVLGVSLLLEKCNYRHIEIETDKYLQMRKNSQPEGRSLGSVFKAYNGKPAAKYIDELSIKGKTIGGAEISDKHCNFIINRGNATTDDYINLARYMQDEVNKRFDVLLETELTYIGEADEDFRRLSHPYDLQPW